jgi:hypothetical protein
MNLVVDASPAVSAVAAGGRSQRQEMEEIRRGLRDLHQVITDLIEITAAQQLSDLRMQISGQMARRGLMRRPVGTLTPIRGPAPTPTIP